MLKKKIKLQSLSATALLILAVSLSSTACSLPFTKGDYVTEIRLDDSDFFFVAEGDTIIAPIDGAFRTDSSLEQINSVRTSGKSGEIYPFIGSDYIGLDSGSVLIAPKNGAFCSKYYDRWVHRIKLQKKR